MFQISPLKIYLDKKKIQELEKYLEEADNINDIVEILSILFHSFYYSMDKINYAFVQIWQTLNELNLKMTTSQKHVIDLVGDNIDSMKEENITNNEIIENISSINDLVDGEIDIAEIKNKILTNAENILNSIKNNITLKEEKIKNYEKVYNNLKLDLEIYERQTKVMQSEIKKAKKEAITDEITGFYTAKVLKMRLEEELEYLKRTKENFNLILININEVNELKKKDNQYVYNYILVHLAKIIRYCTRKMDIVFKYDESNFFILFPKTNKKNSLMITERILETVRSTVFTYKNKNIPVSINITGIEITSNDEPAKNIINKLLNLMKDSKAKGKFSTIFI
jgi:diguanylate cyclase (GGDEF)-like protein